MIEEVRDRLQELFYQKLTDRGIRYAPNRAENLPLPYLKLWELNSWGEEYKDVDELYVRFTFWLWHYDNAMDETFEMTKAIKQVAREIRDEVPEVMVIEKEKEAIRDAQKPDTKCTVIVYKYKLYGGK